MQNEFVKGTLKGTNLFAFTVGIVLVTVGVTLMYILPAYILSTLNATAVFDPADIATAQAKIAQVQAIGFAVVALGLIFVLVSVVTGLGGKKGAYG